MVDGEQKQQTIRAFVALSLGDEVRAVLRERSSALQQQFADFNINWVPWQNFHITLSFIGNIPLSDVAKVTGVMAEASAGVKPFTVSLGDVVLFPPDQQVKGLFVAPVVPDQALKNLQSNIEVALKEAGYKIFDRPYRPHMTIARLKKNRISENELANSGVMLENPVEAVHLYKSERLPGGVVNSIVSTCLLN